MELELATAQTASARCIFLLGQDVVYHQVTAVKDRLNAAEDIAKQGSDSLRFGVTDYNARLLLELDSDLGKRYRMSYELYTLHSMKIDALEQLRLIEPRSTEVIAEPRSCCLIL